MQQTTVIQRLQAKVDALASEFPGVTFGYLGNCGTDSRGAFDETSWYVFLPHPGRIGIWTDRVGGYPRFELPEMESNWERIEVQVRRRMQGVR